MSQPEREALSKIIQDLRDFVRSHPVDVVMAREPRPASRGTPPKHGLLIVDYFDLLPRRTNGNHDR